MSLFEKIESCIRELKSGDRFLELEGLLAELLSENERLRRERDKFFEEAALQRQESEKLLNMFLEQIKQKERMSVCENASEELKAENESLKAELEDAKGWTEAKDKYDAEYKKLLGIGEILGEVNNNAAQKVIEQQKSLEEINAERQKAEEDLFRLQKQKDDIKREYDNTRRLMEELLSEMKGLGDG